MTVRVLLVIDEMEVGGTQRQMLNLVRALDRNSFTVEVAYFRVSSFLIDEFKALGVPVHYVPKRGRLDLSFLIALRRLIVSGGYQLVHAFSFTSELWAGVALKTLFSARRAALISSVRGTYEWYSPTQWRLKRWVTENSALVIANSRNAAGYAAQKMDLPASRIQVVYNGLPEQPPRPPAERAQLRSQCGFADGDFVVLFVGRLIEHKNIPTLLRAMSLLPELADELARPVRLMLAGDGPERQALAALTDALGLRETVQWLGERRDVPALMNACDTVVLPSWREGLSNVILEAMQAGKPVVASRTGGNTESVIPDQTGLLFDPADPQALAFEMLRLASDQPLADRLGSAGRERVAQTFALQTLAEQTEQHYRQVLGLPSLQEVSA